MDVRTGYQFCQHSLFCMEDDNTFEYIWEVFVNISSGYGLF